MLRLVMLKTDFREPLPLMMQVPRPAPEGGGCHNIYQAPTSSISSGCFHVECDTPMTHVSTSVDPIACVVLPRKFVALGDS